MIRCCCPICGTWVDASPAESGAASASLRCPTCSMSFESQNQTPDTAAAAAPSSGQVELTAQSLAWEREQGVLGSLWRTVWQVLLRPVGTFGAPASPKLIWPLSFGFILGTLGSALMVFYDVAFGWDQPLKIGIGPQMILWPLINLASIFIIAAAAHAALWVLRGSKGGFRGTFRVAAYSQASNILMLIPGAGVWIGTVWGLIVTVGGLSAVHGISKGRAAAALFLLLGLFLLLLFLLGLALGLGALMGVMGAQQSAPDLLRILLSWHL